MLRCVWALSKEDVAEHMIKTKECIIKQLLITLMGLLSHADFTLAPMTLLKNWTARRKLVQDNIFKPPMSTHIFMKIIISDLDQVPNRR